MGNSVYSLNKGINRPIEFKGFKAQYIWYLGIGLVVGLVLFAGLYLTGVNTYVCLVVIITGATTWFLRVRTLSHKYGEHGMKKKAARRALPRVLISHSRNLAAFRLLKQSNTHKA